MSSSRRRVPDQDAPGEDVPLRRPVVGGLAAAGADEFSVAAAIGGPRGMAESVLPSLLFIVVLTITGNLTHSLVAALAVAVVAALARLVTRSSPMQAVSGLVGVGICAAFALRTGQARDFFLPGFLINAAYGAVCLATLIPLPKLRVGAHDLPPGSYPLLGLLLGPVTGEGLRWRTQPARRRIFARLTMLWGCFFLLKLVVQVPLYLVGQVQLLGIAKLALGVPAYALMCYLTWLVLRRVPPATAA